MTERVSQAGENVYVYWNDETSQTMRIEGYGPMWNMAAEEWPWDEYRRFVSGVTIQPGITSIGSWSLAGTEIPFVTIPNTVTRICSGAFSSCNLMTFLVLEEGLDEIQESAFDGCEQLAIDLVLPDSVKTVGASAFAYTGIKTLDLNKVEYLGSYAFTGLINLENEKLVIPSTLDMIPTGCFERANMHCTIEFEAPAGLSFIEEYAFHETRLYGDLKLPSTVVIIGTSAFAHTEIGPTIDIPDRIFGIGDMAFSELPFAGEFIIRSENPPTELGNSSFAANVSPPEQYFVMKTPGWGNDTVFTREIRGDFVIFSYITINEDKDLFVKIYNPIEGHATWRNCTIYRKTNNRWKSNNEIYRRNATKWE